MTNEDYVQLPPVSSEPGPPAVESELRRVTALCNAGSCPTVYRTDRGTLVIQGRAIKAIGVGVDLADGEALVEIPEELVTRLAGTVGSTS
jgi:hypothetical protein